jgi:hypothetical protein
MLQEHCIQKYNATVEELLYHSFLGSTIISFFLSLFTGEFISGCHFIAVHGNIYVWSSLIMFSVVGFAGSNFSTGLTLRFGSLVNGITNTARKAVNIGISFALFPSRNHLTTHHVYGAIIFFFGLIIRTLMKDSSSSSTTKLSTDSAELSNTAVAYESSTTASATTSSSISTTDELAIKQEAEDDLDVEIGPILTSSHHRN